MFLLVFPPSVLHIIIELILIGYLYSIIVDESLKLCAKVEIFSEKTKKMGQNRMILPQKYVMKSVFYFKMNFLPFWM